MNSHCERIPYKQIELLNNSIIHLEKIIQHQKQIQLQQKVPWKYSPRTQLENKDTTLQDTFNREFKDLFYKHLEKVISANVISLEIQKTRLNVLIQNAETKMIHMSKSPDNLQQIYDEFLSRTNITNYQPGIALKLRLPTSQTPPMYSRKRGNPKNIKKSTAKRPHVDKHFLEEGHYPLPNNS